MPDPQITFSAPLFPYDRWGGIQAIGQAARHADELGFHALSLPDHVIMTVRDDVPPVSTVWYDNFVLSAHLAALTRRLRFLFNVLVVPYRPPLVLAKLISTLDVVSGGRITLGIGAGWLKGEFRVLGLPFEERGAMTDEYLRAMKVLWTEEKPSFEGRYTSFSRIAFEPRCVQKPHVPLWIGGSGRGPLRRVVELGDGWTPMVGTPDELRQQGDWIREQLAARGRDPASLTFAFGLSFGPPDPERDLARSHAAHSTPTGRKPVSSPQEVIDRASVYRELGFRHLTVSFGWQTPADYLKQLDWFAAHVMPAFR
jgi:probable F420-dependent oxidoreductase